MSELDRAANPTTEEAIKYLERMLFTQDFSPSTLRAKAVNTMAIEALREKQSIVYCKDCKYLGIKDFVYGYCKRDMSGQVQPDDYCSRGVRRKERHDE